MTDTPASGADETPPVDRRPRPQFGELAPEGWTWKPPVAAEPAEESSSTGALPVSPVSPVAPVSASDAVSTGRRVPAWDRVVTLSLLIFGLLATLVTIAMFTGLPGALQTVYTQQDLGTYEPAAAVPGLLLAGNIAAGVTWALTAAVAIMLMMRQRRAFYIPIIGGVLASILMVTVMALVLNTDPTLLDVFGPA